MIDKHDHDSDLPQEQEKPEIYSVSSQDGKTSLTRRRFLEIAAAAAGTAGLALGAYGSTDCPPKDFSVDVDREERPAKAHEDVISTLALNIGGSLLASGDENGNLRLWEVPSGALLHSWSGGIHEITGLGFSSDGLSLFSRNAAGKLKKWSLPDCEEQPFAKIPSRGKYMSIPESGDWLAVFNPWRTEDLLLRSQSTGEETVALADVGVRISTLTTTADGRRLLGGCVDGTLALWNTENARLERVHNDGTAAVVSADVSDDGDFAVTAHADGSVKTWLLPSLEGKRTLDSSMDVLYDIALRPQQDFLLLGGSSQDIRIWDLVNNCEHPGLLAGHLAAVRALAITPDGSLLISAGEDKTIRLWSLPDGELIKNFIDLDINYKHVEGVSYEGRDEFGRAITYTLPCGSPIPAGAVCTCNCVPGSLTIPKNHRQKYRDGVCTCDLICTCNTVCTCQSVNKNRGYSYTVSYWYPN